MADIRQHFKALPGHDKQYVPFSEHLYARRRPVLDEALYLGAEYDRAFDIFDRPSSRAARPEWFPTVHRCSSSRGGIMRGRKRTRFRGPMRERKVFTRGHRVSSETDGQVDESLRALARLLARQAAREAFNRAMSRDADRSTEEGRE